MSYPEYAEVNGKRHKLNTDYKTALRCFGVIEDETIGDYERAIAVVFILFGFMPPVSDLEAFSQKATLFLRCGEKDGKQSDSERDMDFNYDEKFINASFMSDYHIDLNKTPDMHFWQYCELIGGLTEKSILSRVRYIRTCNPDDFAEKDRNSIYAAKEQLALPQRLTPEEREQIERFEALFKD